MTNWNFINLTTNHIIVDDLSFNWFPCPTNENRQYDYSSPTSTIPPLLVQRVSASKYRLVDGFKRFFALNKNAKEDMYFPGFILPDSLSQKEISAIRLNTLSSPIAGYPGFQVGQTLLKLQYYGFSKQELSQTVLPKLGLKPSDHLVRHLLNIVDALATVNNNDALMMLSCEDLLSFIKFQPKQYPLLISLAEKMNIAGKKGRNLLLLLNEVSRIKNQNLTELLQDQQVSAILNNSNLQGPVRHRLLKQLLETWRYPELSKLQRRFEQERQRLQLSKRMTLESHPYFENDDLTLTLKFNSLLELQKQLEKLGDFQTSESVWQEIFRLYDEN